MVDPYCWKYTLESQSRLKWSWHPLEACSLLVCFAYSLRREIITDLIQLWPLWATTTTAFVRHAHWCNNSMGKKSTISWLDLIHAPQVKIHLWHWHWVKNLCLDRLYVLGETLPLLLCQMDIMLRRLLITYCYTHRAMHLSAFREDSFLHLLAISKGAASKRPQCAQP